VFHRSANRSTDARAWRVLCLLLVMFGARSASGDERALDYFVPVVNRVEYVDFCQAMSVTKEQRLILDMLYSDYTRDVDALMTQADASADAAGREAVREALTGRRRLSPEELASRRADVVQAYVDALPKLDRLTSNLLSDLVGMLNPDQQQASPPHTQALLRRAWSRGRSMRSDTPEYGGEGIDLVALWSDVRQLDTYDGSAAARIDARLRTYADDVHRYLVRHARDDRDDVPLRRKADLLGKDDEREAIEARLVDRWLKWYELHKIAIDDIAVLLEDSGGEPVAVDWRERCAAEMFPSTVTAGVAERAARWAAQTLDGERRDQARTLLNDYRRDRSSITTAMQGLHVRARRELGRVVHAMIDPASLDDSASMAMYQELLRLSGEQSTREARLMDAIHVMLTPEERAEMTKAVRRQSRSSSRR